MSDYTEHKKKRLQGTVISNRMQDSAVVSVVRFEKHPRYSKFVKKLKKYIVHNPGNTAEVGQTVMIEETRPISKRKHFAIVEANK